MITEEMLFHDAFVLYQEYGVKFTMGDLAARLGISKKTLYELVSSKDELVTRAVSHYFDAVEREQADIRKDNTLSALQKTERLLCVNPQMPFREYRIRELRRSFPGAYLQLTEHLETEWEKIFSVMDEAIAQGFLMAFDKTLFGKIYAYVIEGLMLEREQRAAVEFAEEQCRAVRMLLGGICTGRGRDLLCYQNDSTLVENLLPPNQS